MEVFGGTHGIFMTFIIGLIVGIVAKFLMPGKDPGGFIITAIIGIVGSFVATWLGQAIGWYRADQGAGFIMATVGAVVVLFIWNRLVTKGVIGDPGNRTSV